MTKYESNRAMIMTELAEFIISNFGKVLLEDYIYDAEVIKYFITEHRWKNKNLLLIHTSAILNQVSNMNTNLKTPQLDINLKNRLDFQDLLQPKKPKKPNQFLDFQGLKTLICDHNEGHNIYSCFAFLQLSLGIRFNNLSHLTSNLHFYTPSTCNLCNASEICGMTTDKCFGTITFKTSKTDKVITTHLIPQAMECYQRILNLPSNFCLVYGQYNNYLKSVKIQDLKTHQLRKFLCNLCVAHRNTGTWASEKTMKNHYLASHIQFFEFYKCLKEAGLVLRH